MQEGTPPLLIVGWIQKPHGIRGELFVKLATDRPEALFAPGRVLRLGDAEGRPTAAPSPSSGRGRSSTACC
jgi:ribosomal 30S subunit maturation factor RimM